MLARAWVAFVFKVLERLSQFWHAIEQPEELVRLFVEQEKAEPVAA